MSITTTVGKLSSSCIPGYDFDREHDKFAQQLIDSDYESDDYDEKIECDTDGTPISKSIEVEIGTIKYHKYYKPISTHNDLASTEPGSIVGSGDGKMRLLLHQLGEYGNWPLDCVEFGQQEVSFYQTEDCDFKYGWIDLDDLFERINFAFKK
jgi:hypothetical protein